MSSKLKKALNKLGVFVLPQSVLNTCTLPKGQASTLCQVDHDILLRKKFLRLRTWHVSQSLGREVAFSFPLSCPLM